jgi:hypothetical protein
MKIKFIIKVGRDKKDETKKRAITTEETNTTNVKTKTKYKIKKEQKRRKKKKQKIQNTKYVTQYY